MENENINIPEYISKLSQIKKDELTEREFYEKVLEQLSQAEELTPETHELLKETLTKIGCKKYSDWKEEKESQGEKIEDLMIGDGLEIAYIGSAVSMIAQFFNKYDSAIISQERMEDWIEEWLENSKKLYGKESKTTNMESKNKLNIPYYQVAKSALMNWNGLSEEEATSKIENSTFEEIEGQVWAKGSMDYAIDSIAKRIFSNDKEKEELESEIYNGEPDRYIGKYGTRLTEMEFILAKKEIDPNAFIMDTLFAVHDGWVKDNGKKFLAREKKHQHMPSELIGWKEAKADLLFIRPIFEAAGIEINEEELEKEYNKRVKEFFLENKISNTDDLAKLISKGADFYPALEDQEDIITHLEDEVFVATEVIPQIEKNGIGDILNIRVNILEDIAENPKREDLERLTDPEKSTVNNLIDLKVKMAMKQLYIEKNKNKLVEEILNKNEELQKVNKEIEELKNKRKDTDNRNDFGE